MFNPKIILTLSVFFIATFAACKTKDLNPHHVTSTTKEERFCCLNILKDSTKTWCEKVELIQGNCKITVGSCWDCIVNIAEEKTGIYSEKIGADYGINYPNLNEDLKKWKEKLGCQ